VFEAGKALQFHLWRILRIAPHQAAEAAWLDGLGCGLGYPWRSFPTSEGARLHLDIIHRKNRQLVTRRFAINDIVKAYDRFGNSAKEGTLKVVLKNGMPEIGCAATDPTPDVPRRQN
jgi:hypothetical protein